jgi:hypothetical protein
VYRLLRGHYSSVFAPTDSFVNPVWLSPTSAFGLVRGVFAGCYQSLLPPGLSRRYLCESLLRCLSPYPGGPSECMCLVLPQSHRPCPTKEGSASRFFPRTRFSAVRVSRLQLFHYVQASEIASLPDRSYRCKYFYRAAEAFTSELNVRCCLRTHRICFPPDYRQLAVRGLAPRWIPSLVGCSPLLHGHYPASSLLRSSAPLVDVSSAIRK